MTASEFQRDTTALPRLEAGAARFPISRLALSVGVFTYLLGLALGNRLLGDPDTYLHIGIGRWIWEHGAVPATDPFSFTMAGHVWVAHEWLAELAFAGAYQTLGWAGVVALTALAFAVAFAALVLIVERWLSPPAAILIAAASFVLLAPHLTARPHLLALPILAIWTGLLEAARVERRLPSLWLVALIVLWANLHGSFILGLALLGFYGLDAALREADGAARRRCAYRWGALLAAAILSSVATPYGWRGLWLAFHLVNESYALSLIGEWQSTDFSRFQPLEVWLLGLIAFGFLTRMRIPAMKLLLLLGLLHLALQHGRDSDLLAVIGPIILAEPLQKALRAPPIARKAQRRAAMVPFLAGVAFMAAATGALAVHGRVPDQPRIAPAAALAAARSAGVSGPVLNSYNFGGYLIDAGIAPFIDGRVDLYGDAFVHRYMDAMSDDGNALAEVLDRYRIGWTLLQPDMQAVAALDRLPGWRRVYADDAAVVYVRRAP